MSRPRDSQRSKVYKAEVEAFPGIHEAAWGTLDECEAFAERVKATDYWQSNDGWMKVSFGDGRGRRRACYKGAFRRVCLPKWARNRWVIVHEMAHCLTHKTHGMDVPAHGSTFCTHYAHLARELFGTGAAALLVAKFNEHGASHNAQHFLDAVVAEWIGEAAA